MQYDSRTADSTHMCMHLTSMFIDMVPLEHFNRHLIRAVGCGNLTSHTNIDEVTANINTWQVLYGCMHWGHSTAVLAMAERMLLRDCS